MIIDTQTGRQPKIIEHFPLANMTYIYFLKLKIYTHILCICSMYMFIKYYELFLKLLHIYIISQYATGNQWRNNSRKNEGKEPKQKQ